MALNSPGVEVNVIDESIYTPSAPGSVPMIFVATASNKTSATGSGIAPATTKQNAGRPYLVTGQRELGELFGDPIFYSDNNNNMIHGGELNEYGLQTAYSALGITNRVYVVRADIDLSKLTASAFPPSGEPANGAHWFDTATTSFGLMEWNGAPIAATGGQSFSSVSPIRLDDAFYLVDPDNSDFTPKGSVGSIGDYAVVTYADSNQVWYKSPGRAVGLTAGQWVRAGSTDWMASFPTVRGDSAPVISAGDFEINGTPITVASGDTIDDVVASINSAVGSSGVSAANVRGVIEIYSDGRDVELTDDSATLGDLGFTAGTYYAPRVHVGSHTNVPAFRSGDSEPAPTGSLWVKTTVPNGGAAFDVFRYNGDTGLWDQISAPLYTSSQAALYGLDRTGGGVNLTAGDLYVKVNSSESADPIVNYRIFERAVTGAISTTSEAVTDTTFTPGNIEFDLWASVEGTATLDGPVTVTAAVTGSASGDAEAIATAIANAGLEHVSASTNADNQVTVTHAIGGEIRITESGVELGGIFDTSENFYDAPVDSGQSYVISAWRQLDYTASDSEPRSGTEDGELWYNSVVDEVDIMVNDGEKWVGYLNEYSNTSATGPYVGASEPEGTPAENDLWIDTSDIDNYPTIRRYVDNVGWVLVDKTDQTSDQGILFADARWSTAGELSEAADIVDLLESDYVDPDAPDPALYPRGMLLWNLRRSGFNVKRYVKNYIDPDEENIRFNDELMRDYALDRWVTESANNEDGSGSFGRKAQRKAVVQALQSEVNSNQEIRDDESRQFNLIACPGYPELIGEMITLNVDRGLKSFVVGDTPARLTPDATTLIEWAQNTNGAVEDNEVGAVSFDEYMAMYYGWGYTSDNAGNNVVVPPSHMSLRTILLNDQVAYPWYAPAGTRRGGVSNATASGYITDEGEFNSISLNVGQRDVLYENSVNPITFINGSGLLVYGQKTRARNASALDRVNVARLVVYLRTQLDQIARPYLFEPNDKITRDQVKAAMDSFFLELVGLRAIYDFLVVCDESNNLAARIDRNELWIDIAIEPVKSIEYIYIPLRLKNTGEISG